jgi:hypothetical protein
MVPVIANLKTTQIYWCALWLSLFVEKPKSLNSGDPSSPATELRELVIKRTAGHHIGHNSHCTDSLGPAPCARIPEIRRRAEETHAHVTHTEEANYLSRK